MQTKQPPSAHLHHDPLSEKEAKTPQPMHRTSDGQYLGGATPPRHGFPVLRCLLSEGLSFPRAQSERGSPPPGPE